MNIRDVLDYIKNFFVAPELTRKRRAEDPLEFLSPTKTRKLQLSKHSTNSYNMSNDIIDLCDDEYPRAKRASTKTRITSRLPMETITLDDDMDILTIKRGNETRFQRTMSGFGSAKYTSTPEDRPHQNGTSDDDDVVLVKETVLGPSSARSTRMSKQSSSLLGNSVSYIKPFTGSSYLRSMQYNGNCTSRPKENIKPRLSNNITKRGSLGSLNHSFRLDDKMQYRKLLDKAASNESSNTSIYSTPVGKLFDYDTASLTRNDKILAMALKTNANKKSSVSGPRLSTKDRIKRILDNFDSEAVEVKDSDSESDVIIVSPPSPKPDIIVEPVNSFQKVVELVPTTKSDWIDDMVAKHKRNIEERQKEVDVLRQCASQHEKINKDLRLELLADRVNRSLQLKEQILPVEEERQEIELPVLSSAQLKQVDKAFRGDPNEVLAKKFSLNITRRDMLTLAGLNWLNDEVINFYMNLIIERGKNSKWPQAYAFNTFFYMKLINSGPQSLRRWTKKIDIFSYDLICVPIHLGVHWCMAIIDFRDKSIRYYDSMGSENDRCLKALKNYLEAEHLDKRKTPYDTSDFSLENVKDIPQQMNGSDCGMFACTFAEFISRNASVNFSQDHMPYFRKKMVVEILDGELLIQ